MTKMIVKAFALWALVVTSLFAMPEPARGQRNPQATYRLNVGDNLLLSVPDRPTLTRSVKIQANGTINLPLLGPLPAAGLTVAELETSVLQAIQGLYPSIRTATVTVEEMQGIYVTGEVGKPGKYTFANAPNLWEAIREAGGPRAGAAMSEVRIVKGQNRPGETVVVNVQDALESGSVDDLPLLDPGDTVIVPQIARVYTGSGGVNVTGAVIHPGIYRLEGRRDLMSAILLAGGPTRRASLKDVILIRPQPDGTYVTESINLQRYLAVGDVTMNPLLQPGATVNIPEQNPVTYQIRNNFGIVLSVITSVLSIAWLAIRINSR